MLNVSVLSWYFWRISGATALEDLCQWEPDGIQLLVSVIDARRGVSFLCRLAGLEQRHSIGLMTHLTRLHEDKLMGWRLLHSFGDTHSSVKAHYQTVAHVHCLTRFQFQMLELDSRCSCLQLPVLWATSFGLVVLTLHFPLPQGWRCITYGFGSSHSARFLSSHFTAPGIRVRLVADVQWKAGHSSRASLLEVADPRLIDTFLSAPIAPVCGSSRRSPLFSLWKVSASLASPLLPSGLLDGNCAHVETLKGAFTERSIMLSRNYEANPGLGEVEGTWRGGFAD